MLSSGGLLSSIKQYVLVVEILNLLLLTLTRLGLGAVQTSVNPKILKS
jgi:hypothetical protein